MKKDLENKTWQRLLFMAGFGVLSYLVLQVLFVLATIQFGFNLLTGKSNDELSNLCRKITSYLYDIALFLIFEEHLLPYPFIPISSYTKRTRKKNTSN